MTENNYRQWIGEDAVILCHSPAFNKTLMQGLGQGGDVSNFAVVTQRLMQLVLHAVWISGTVQTALYADFFYYYFRSWQNNEKLSLPT